MTGFSADWLALREPFDHAARCASAASLDLRGAAFRMRGGDPTLAVLDLACGTGANLRELAPRLGGAQRWTLVDHDPRLLDALPHALQAWAHSRGFVLRTGHGGFRVSGADWDAQVQTLCVDLALGLDDVPLSGTHLITASALLDLVSSQWLAVLLVQALDMNAALLFALTVDGRVAWEPGVPGDAEIDRLFAAHQRRDKGFGEALGGKAVDVLTHLLAAAGCELMQAASDWRIDAREGARALAMVTAMVEGAGAAALEQDPCAGTLVNEWMARRLALADSTRLLVGHQDVLAMRRQP